MNGRICRAGLKFALVRQMMQIPKEIIGMKMKRGTKGLLRKRGKSYAMLTIKHPGLKDYCFHTESG